jgi:hypothetical protein
MQSSKKRELPKNSNNWGEGMLLFLPIESEFPATDCLTKCLLNPEMVSKQKTQQQQPNLSSTCAWQKRDTNELETKTYLHVYINNGRLKSNRSCIACTTKIQSTCFSWSPHFSVLDLILNYN